MFVLLDVCQTKLHTDMYVNYTLISLHYILLSLDEFTWNLLEQSIQQNNHFGNIPGMVNTTNQLMFMSS